jgi:hypothetical protein
MEPEFGLTAPVPPGQLTRAGYCATIFASVSASTAALTIRTLLSPPSYLRQLYQEARALPRHTRIERYENLYSELAALAAANKEKERGEVGLNDNDSL